MINDFFNSLILCLYPFFLLYTVFTALIVVKLNLKKNSQFYFYLAFFSILAARWFINDYMMKNHADILFIAEFILNTVIVIFSVWFLFAKSFTPIGKTAFIIFALIVLTLKLSLLSFDGYSSEISFNESSGQFENVTHFPKIAVYLTGQLLGMFTLVFLCVQQFKKYSAQKWFPAIQRIITVFVLLNAFSGILYSLMLLFTKTTP